MPLLATITAGQVASIEGDNAGYDNVDPILYREGFNDNHSLHIGFRFLVPSSIPSANIDKIEFRFYVSNGFGNGAMNMPLRIPHAEVTSIGSGAANPMVLYDNATTSTTVTFTDTIPASGYTAWKELTAADVRDAIDSNADHATDGTWIGVVNHAPASGNVIWSIGGIGSGVEPEMKVYSPTPANFTATIDSAMSLTPTMHSNAYVANTGIAYYGVSALGTAETAGTYRYLDLYTPVGGSPSGGWPVIVYVHGGRWITGNKSIGASENNISQGFVDKMTQQGYAVVSVEYRKMQETINPNAIVNSFPRNLHDIYASLKWVETNAGTYDLNEEKVVISGHSAGGYLAAFAGIVASIGDSTTYNGSQNSSSDRPAGYGYSDSASPWQFDLDESGELSVSNPPVGIMLWDAPIDVYQATIIADPAGTANTQARKALMGEVINQPVYAGEDEADLNHYIAGDGTIYTSAKNPSNIPPIFFMYSTTQDLVTNASSITALSSSLNSVGYDVSTSSGVLNTNDGLTRHGVARDHADVLRDQSPNFTEEIAWLNQVAPATNPNTHYVGTNAVSKIYLGSTEITKAYLGSTEIWP